jgi:UDP-N-acetylglucosamine/UDP-N-acetylgalactosamine diphosphorylase
MNQRPDPTHLEEVRDRLRAFGQDHVLQFWNQLDEAERQSLLGQAASIDLESLQKNIDTLVKDEEAAVPVDFDKLRPAPFIAHPRRGGDAALWEEARERGGDLLAAGKVAAFTVAGGQDPRALFRSPRLGAGASSRCSRTRFISRRGATGCPSPG